MKPGIRERHQRAERKAARRRHRETKSSWGRYKLRHHRHHRRGGQMPQASRNKGTDRSELLGHATRAPMPTRTIERTTVERHPAEVKAQRKLIRRLRELVGLR